MRSSQEPRNCSAEKTGRRVARGHKRREEIAAIAEHILERGFTETIMKLVRCRAGASKETLYRHFPQGGVVRRKSSGGARRDNRRTRWRAGYERHAAEVLGSLGLNLLRFLTSRDSLSFYRIMVAEATARRTWATSSTRKVRRVQAR
jgi:AcrR family transcriptional regulator